MLRFSKNKVGSQNEKNSGKTKERKGASDGYGHLNLSTLKSGQSKNLLVLSHTGVFGQSILLFNVQYNRAISSGAKHRRNDLPSSMSLAFVLGCALRSALGKNNACVQAIPVNEIHSFVKQTYYFTSEVNLPVIRVS